MISELRDKKRKGEFSSHRVSREPEIRHQKIADCAILGFGHFFWFNMLKKSQNPKIPKSKNKNQA
jgi:hypothetical protein